MTQKLIESLEQAKRSVTEIELKKVESFGRLIRVNGMLFTVTGGSFTLGWRYQIEDAKGNWKDAEVIGFENSHAYLMLLENQGDFSTGARVRPCPEKQQLFVSEKLLGRVLNGLGRPLDGQPSLKQGEPLKVENTSLNPLSRRGVEQALDVGVKVINGLFTVGKGQRLGLFAGSGVGKSKLLAMMTKFTEADVVIVAMVGERGWEVRDFIKHSLGEAGLSKSIVIAAPADQSPLLRMRSAELAHSLASWYREQGKDVLLLVDSLTRYAQAQREIALSVGEPPATRGYPPSVFSKLTQLVECAGNSESTNGTMTAIYTVLAEGDDQQDPIVDGARAILDGHVVLRRELAERGHYPAIDIGSSISRIMPNIVPEAQLNACYKLKLLYSRYRQVEELIPIGAYQPGKDNELDQAVALYPKICEFLKQGLNEAVSFSKTVELLNTLMADHA